MSIAAAFKGTLVHCPSLGRLEILEDHLLREDSRSIVSPARRAYPYARA